MRWTHWIPTLALFAAFAAALTLIAAAPASMDARTKRVAHGEYLVTTSGCGDCHTPGTFYGSPDFSRRLAGSEMGWRGPWGVSYAANLTPDPETGIGKWTEKQIVDAIRTGMRPDGRALMPPMPWPNMATMTDDDAYAIAAYLKSLAPVSHRVPAIVAPPDAPNVKGPLFEFPPPSAWDAPRPTPGGSAPDQH